MRREPTIEINKSQIDREKEINLLVNAIVKNFSHNAELDRLIEFLKNDSTVYEAEQMLADKSLDNLLGKNHVFFWENYPQVLAKLRTKQTNWEQQDSTKQTQSKVGAFVEDTTPHEDISDWT